MRYCLVSAEFRIFDSFQSYEMTKKGKKYKEKQNNNLAFAVDDFIPALLTNKGYSIASTLLVGLQESPKWSTVMFV